MQNWQDVQSVAAAVKALLRESSYGEPMPRAGLILGTGLSPLAHSLSVAYNSLRIPFSEVPGFPAAGAPGHDGAFLFCDIEGLPALVQQGRSHLYEGRSPAEVCMGVRLMSELGVKTLILTNAAGALNPAFEPGSIMLINDIINFTGLSPLTGPNDERRGERFPDMSEAMDWTLRRLASATALKLGIKLESGVYIGVHGPEMETPAETRMYRNFGADAIGMSSVLEIIAARHCGLRVLGLSCLTNKNLPDCMSPAPLSLVLETAEKCGADLARLLKAVCGVLARKSFGH